MKKRRREQPIRNRRYARYEKVVVTSSGEEYTVERYFEADGLCGSILVLNVYRPWKSWLFGWKRGLVYSIEADDDHEVQSVYVGFQASFRYAAEKYEEMRDGEMSRK